MFAVVRTGGKQYRVAAGDKIAVEKLAGEAGDTVTLGDVLLAGNGDALEDAGKVTVSAEIIAQAKSEKVIVFKKRRRHNYRRKAGHRQQMTLLRITAVGDDKYEKADAAPVTETAAKADPAPVVAQEAAPAAAAAPASAPKAKKAAPKKYAAPAKSGTHETETGGEAQADASQADSAPAKKAPAKKAAATKSADSK